MQGGQGEEGETECTLRTAVAEQADRQMGEGRRLWERQSEGGVDGLKGLPLLGMWGTGSQGAQRKHRN